MHVTRVLGVLARRPLFPRTEADALATLRATFGNLAADSALAPRPAPVAAGTHLRQHDSAASETDRAAA